MYLDVAGSGDADFTTGEEQELNSPDVAVGNPAAFPHCCRRSRKCSVVYCSSQGPSRMITELTTVQWSG